MEEQKKFLPYSLPLIGEEEIEEVVDTLRNGWLTMGPKTIEFEKRIAEYIGVKHAICVNSCTAGLHLSLIALGIGKEDEVILSPYTFAATGNVICHVGAKPVFVDVEEDTFNIDPKKIEQAITPRTKAIIVVHYAGQSADLDEIKKIADKYNLKIIEDAAHAIGSEYKGKKVGSFGNLTSYSFYAIKNMTTGEGGAIVTNDDALAERLRKLRLHGISKDAWKRYGKGGSWFYEIEEAGWKYNITDIQSAIGMHQLEKLDNFIKKRKEYAEIYDKEFSKISRIKIPSKVSYANHVYHLYPILLKNYDRNKFMEEMEKKNIGTSVHFIPLHLHPFYQKTFGYKKGDFPVAEKLYERVVSLPLYPKMTEEDLQSVINAVNEILNSPLDVLLVHPTNYKVYDSVKKGRSKTPPMGIAYIASVLRKNGFNIELLDAEAQNFSIEETIEIISKKNPSVLGITCTTPLIQSAAEICSKIKELNPNTVTVIGGPHISARPKESMEYSKSIDYAITKEGEYTFLELVQLLKEKKDPSQIRGLVYRRGTEVIVNEPRELISDLDEIPFPARDLLPQEKYIFVLPASEEFTKRYGENFAVIISSRGCPFQCIFCDSCATFGKRVRMRSAKNVADEIEEVVKRFNTRIFYIDDDTFTINKQRAIDICKEIVERKLDITFLTTSRVDTIDEDICYWLKRAGCFMVNMGVESGNEKILKVIKKGITKERVREAVRLVKKHGMYTYLSFMIGNPEETEETIQDTIEFAKELEPFHSQFSIAIPFPGTELWEIAKRDGLIETEDFSKYLWYYSTVYVPKGLTKERLLELQKEAYDALGHSHEKKIEILNQEEIQMIKGDIMLKEFNKEDLELMMSWRSHPKVYKYFYEQKNKGELSWEEHYKFWNSRRDRIDWIIYFNDGNSWRRVGTVNASNLSEIPEIGILIGEVTLMGKGIGTKSLGMVCDWLAKKGYKFASAKLSPENIASQKLFEKLNFVRKSFLPDRDEWLYELDLNNFK